MDTLGLLIGVTVHPANIQDRDGATILFGRLRKGRLRRLQKIFADSAYGGRFIDDIRDTCGWIVEIVKGLKEQVGFVVQKKRWIVERTFGWLNRYRRLSKDYEQKTHVSEALIMIAMINVMAHKLRPG